VNRGGQSQSQPRQSDNPVKPCIHRFSISVVTLFRFHASQSG
jgi:hypothetical protein